MGKALQGRKESQDEAMAAAEECGKGKLSGHRLVGSDAWQLLPAPNWPVRCMYDYVLGWALDWIDGGARSEGGKATRSFVAQKAREKFITDKEPREKLEM